jgi:hypothetical protein
MKFACILITVMLGIIRGYSQTAPVDWSTVQVVTENLPPLGYLDERDSNRLKGATAEQVQAAMNHLGITNKIEVYPWPRALAMVQDSADVFIFNLARTAERENLFQWVYKTAEKKIGVFALKGRSDIVIHSFNDLKKYKIVVLDQDIAQLILLQRGFDKAGNNVLYPMTPEVNIIRFLFDSRADVWVKTYLTEHDIDNLIKAAEKDPKQFVKIFDIDELPVGLYLATGLQTAGEKVRLFADAMKSVQSKVNSRKNLIR